MKTKTRRAAPSWVTWVRALLGLSFALWAMWAILDADKMSKNGMLLRGAFALLLLIGAVALQRLYPEKKAAKKLGAARS